jgi:hypothetical protein
MARTPRHAIAEVPEGRPVRIVGTIAAGEHVIAPISGRACVFYRAVVQERQKGWETIVDESFGVPFVIEDGTGRALVVPDGAEKLVEHDAPTRSDVFADPTEDQESFFARNEMSGEGQKAKGPLRCSEGALEIGDTVAVYGIAVREPDPDGAARAHGYRDALPTRLRLTNSPKLRLLISDFADTKR